MRLQDNKACNTAAFLCQYITPHPTHKLPLKAFASKIRKYLFSVFLFGCGLILTFRKCKPDDV